MFLINKLCLFYKKIFPRHSAPGCGCPQCRLPDGALHLVLDRRRACETVAEQQEVAAVVSGIAVVHVIVGVADDACALV